MEFQFIVIIVALIVLVISLFMVYLNLQETDKQFPRAMTNCPDYWDINKKNGNCIIPSEDISGANIGWLKNTGKPYYIYNDHNTIQLSTNPIKGGNYYTPYKDNNYKIYSYSKNPEKIPGYIDVSLNVPVDKKLMKNVNNMKLDMITGNEINFNDIAWLKYDIGNSKICNIKKWLNTNNILWDGITNYNRCP